MNASADPAPEPHPVSSDALRLLWEELACAIAASQAALYSGSFQDLETATAVQQEVCSKIRFLMESMPSPERGCAREPAEHVRQQNLVLAATISRMQRHLDSLRGVLDGPFPSYGFDRTHLVT